MCVREHLDLGFWIGPAYALDADCNGCFDLMDDKVGLLLFGRDYIPGTSYSESSF